MQKLLTTLALFGAVSASYATVIVNVDFNEGWFFAAGPTTSGSAVLGSVGDVWNGIGNQPGFDATGLSLVDTAGAASGVTLSFTAEGGWNEDPKPFASDLLRDYISDYEADTAATSGFSFAGLTPNSPFNLVVYVNAHNAGSRRISITVDGNTQLSNVNTTPSSFVLNDNYMLFSNVMSNGSGVLSGTFTGIGGEGSIHGMQLAIPEPSTYAAIAGALALGLVAWRRRR